MRDLLRRVREPSSWAGLAALVEGVKFVLPQYAGLLVGLQAVLGGVAVILREGVKNEH